MSSMPVTGLTPGEDVVEPADLVVRNGRIYTGDPTRPAASALAVRGGRVVSLGDDRDMAGLVGPSTRLVDALGRRVIPGLNDSHLHVVRTGLHFLLETRWDGVRSLRHALAMLAEQARRTPEGQWVRVVGGWSKDQFAEGRLPTLDELNAAAPDTPVMVTHLYQSVLLNRAAVRAVGLARDTAEVPGGQIVRDAAGEPTGLLLATPAAGLLYTYIAKAPTLDAGGQLESTRHWLRELNRFGLTSALDAAGGFQNYPEHYAAVRTLAERGELTLRIGYYLYPQVPGQELDDIRRWTSTLRFRDGDDWLRLQGAGENLVWSAADFENFTEPRPVLAEGAHADLEAAVRLIVEGGWGFRLHATYDETITGDLEVFERVARDGGFAHQVPWILDHAETISEKNIEHVAALGGAFSIQDRMVFQGRAFVERYGAANAPPVRSMLESGVVVGAGTDAPRVASYNPWVCLEWLVRGRVGGGIELFGHESRLDRETALRLYTLGGARLVNEDDRKGMLAPGYLADLAILSDDFFGVPEEDISSIESLCTVVGGRVVYAAREYQGLDEALAPISVPWSPVAHFAGYQASPRASSGLRQAAMVAEVAHDALDQYEWRRRQDETPPALREDGCEE